MYKNPARLLLSLSMLTAAHAAAQTEEQPASETVEPTTDTTTTAVETPAPEVTAATTEEAAPEEAPAESFWPTSLHAAGFVDAYFMHNFNDPPRAAATALHSFDVAGDQFALNLAEFAIWIDPSPVGFRIDLDFGPSADIVAAGEGAGVEITKHIQQAYGTAFFDIGGGLTLDVGKFVTPFGQEVIETRDNWAYSRSLLFQNAIPFYHFGVRATYTFSDSFTAALYAVNGWNNVADNNDSKSFILATVIKPSDMLTLYVNGMAGPERSDGNDNDVEGDWRILADATALLALGDLQLALNGDFGVDPNALGSKAGRWGGVALSGRYAITDWFAAALRAEVFLDRGSMTGANQTVFEGTATLEARYANNFIARLEYRHDQSNKQVFPSDGAPKKGEDTVLLGTVIGF